MSVVHKTEDGEILLVKGAPELLLDRCDGMILPSMGKLSFRPMTTYDRRQAERQNKDWAARGLRVLAIACRPWKGGKNGKVYKKFSKSSHPRSGGGGRMIFLSRFSCLPAEKMIQ